MTDPEYLSLDTFIKLLFGLVASIALIAILSGCATLQKEKGFNNYSKNQIWRITK